MFTRRKIIKSALIGFGSLAVPQSLLAQSASSRYGIVGQKAPELGIDYWIDKNGKPTSFNLADNKGKWVLLKCFQSWCPGCHAHGLPTLKKISDALKNNPKVTFAGIQTVFEGHGVNTKAKVRKIQLQYDLQIPMGHDPGINDENPKTMVDYRTGGTPWMILINPEQTVVYNAYHLDADKAIEFLTKETA